ncbi:MAG: hypothetical protein JWM58_3049 [Rhizobium sp.]|nr:hypothetical protein [Rhizobium sp.]
MSNFMRFSAAAASIVVISSAFGFGLATTMLSANELALTDNGTGPNVASPGTQSRLNTETRSIAGARKIVLASRSIASLAFPAMNQEGPAAGVPHANLGRTRAITSACLMAMN